MKTYIVALATDIEDGGFDYNSVHDNDEDAFRVAVRLANQHPVDYPCILVYDDGDEEHFDGEYVETSFMGCYIVHKKEFDYYKPIGKDWKKNGDFMIKNYSGFDGFDANHELNQKLSKDPLDCYIISTFYFDNEFNPKFIVNNKEDLLKRVKEFYFDMNDNVIVHRCDKNGAILLDETYFHSADELSEEDIQEVIDNL